MNEESHMYTIQCPNDNFASYKLLAAKNNQREKFWSINEHWLRCTTNRK